MNDTINTLFNFQLKSWEMAASNYDALHSVISKKMHFADFEFLIQFNPARIRSSNAKVDVKSIRERQCFLCLKYLPSVQEGIDYKEKYTLLLNPFPIFPKHFTIPHKNHTDQLIQGRLPDMLDLAKDLSDFVILYNGPRSGASAPDHFHFQAGNKGFLPVEHDICAFPRKRKIVVDDNLLVYEMENYLRKTLVLESSDPNLLVKKFEEIYRVLHSLQSDEVEPMMNILVSYHAGVWTLVLFPRREHRPAQFFKEGEDQILFSPGVVDFCGVLIFPREEDFNKITKELVADMFSQLTLSDEDWRKLKEEITR